MQGKVQSISGWNVLRHIEYSGTIEESEKYSIRQNIQGEKAYFAKIPELSEQEKCIMQEIASGFQARPLLCRKEEIAGFIEEYCVENRVYLERQQSEEIAKALEFELFGFSALDFFLSDRNIEEIAVTGTGKQKPVFVFHREHGWTRTNVFFENEIKIKELVNRMARNIGRRLTLETPRLNACLPCGSRICALIPPLSKEPSITIRKFTSEPFTPAMLAENNTLSYELCAFLWLALELECSFLIAGNTGSGKTSTMNSLFSFVPCHERIIVVEETPEIVLPHEHFVKINAAKEQGFEMPELIADTLRMRPDRIIVSEIRNAEEMLAFKDTLLAGQGRGSYATFHAQSSKEAITRMNFLGMNMLEISAIDLLLVQRRWADNSKSLRTEKRRITEVCEIIFENNKTKLNSLFTFDFEKKRLLAGEKSRRVFSRAEDYLGMNAEEFEKELVKRKKFLEGTDKKNGMKDFFEKLQEYRRRKK